MLVQRLFQNDRLHRLGAVSTILTPLSIIWRMAAIDSSVSTSPHVTPAEFAPAIPHVPTVQCRNISICIFENVYIS